MIKRKLTLLGALVLTSPLFAQAPVGPELHGIRTLRQELGLTDDQVKQVRALRKQQAEQLKPQREQMRAGVQNLRALMNAENPDPTAIGKQMLELKQSRTSLRQARASRSEKLQAILTPEQQAKLKIMQSTPEQGRLARRARALGLIAPNNPAPLPGKQQ